MDLTNSGKQLSVSAIEHFQAAATVYSLNKTLSDNGTSVQPDTIRDNLLPRDTLLLLFRVEHCRIAQKFAFIFD